MAAKTQVPVEEYLRMSFDGPDREYRDGEIVERNVGENQHSAIQWRLAGIFFVLSRTKPLFGRPELRLKVGPRDYLIPDLSIFAGEPPNESYPSLPPYVAAEVLSPDDRMRDATAKLEVYRQWGVPNIWLIDPYSKRLYVYGDNGLHEVTSYSLSDYQVTLPADEIFGE